MAHRDRRDAGDQQPETERRRHDGGHARGQFAAWPFSQVRSGIFEALSKELLGFAVWRGIGRTREGTDHRHPLRHLLECGSLSLGRAQSGTASCRFGLPGASCASVTGSRVSSHSRHALPPRGAQARAAGRLSRHAGSGNARGIRSQPHRHPSRRKTKRRRAQARRAVPRDRAIGGRPARAPGDRGRRDGRPVLRTDWMFSGAPAQRTGRRIHPRIQIAALRDDTT